MASNCLHRYTDAIFNPFTERDKDLPEKNPEGVFYGTSIVLLKKQLLMKVLFKNQQTYENILLELMLAKYTPTRRVKNMPTGSCTPWVPDSENSTFTPLQNKTCGFEKMVKSYFQRTAPEFKIESFYTYCRKKWSVQCWWVLFSLHHFVRGNGLLLSLLPLSRGALICYWRRNQTW